MPAEVFFYVVQLQGVHLLGDIFPTVLSGYAVLGTRDVEENGIHFDDSNDHDRVFYFTRYKVCSGIVWHISDASLDLSERLISCRLFQLITMCRSRQHPMLLFRQHVRVFLHIPFRYPVIAFFVNGFPN